MLNKLIIAAAAALGLCATSSALRADERYYMILFAAQSEPKTVRLSHTSAAFIKATGTGTATVDYKIETQSISWMPKDLAIQPVRTTPVPGVNLSLADSLQWAKSAGISMTMWGPFRIRKELYDLAVKQAERLSKTTDGHIIIDGKYRGNGGSNCIHALSDLDTTQALLNTGTAFGVEGTEMVLNHFRSYIVPNKEPTDWLVERLKLKLNEIRVAKADTVAAGATVPVQATK